jgi:hypothetical protein
VVEHPRDHVALLPRRHQDGSRLLFARLQPVQGQAGAPPPYPMAPGRRQPELEIHKDLVRSSDRHRQGGECSTSPGTRPGSWRSRIPGRRIALPGRSPASSPAQWLEMSTARPWRARKRRPPSPEPLRYVVQQCRSPCNGVPHWQHLRKRKQSRTTSGWPSLVDTECRE